MCRGGLGTKITMKDYAPQVFERLRELASVSFEDYIVRHLNHNLLIAVHDTTRHDTHITITVTHAHVTVS